MKTLPSAYAAHLAGGTTTLAEAMKITRADAEVYAFTSHDRDATIDGVDYLHAQGLDASQIVIAADLSVGNLELTTLNDGSLFTLSDILGRVWVNADFEIFRYNWAGLTDGVEYLLGGTFGEVRLRQNTVVVELRDLRQYLQQAVGAVSSKTCRARLGDARCTKDLTSFTHTGTLDGVTSQLVFEDSGRAEADDYFGEGIITFTTGDNTGRSAKVKTFSAGVFTLAQPMWGAVQIGDEYVVIAGCRKRVDEDCADKFDNVLNFDGEPHRKGVNDIAKPADAA